MCYFYDNHYADLLRIGSDSFHESYYFFFYWGKNVVGNILWINDNLWKICIKNLVDRGSKMTDNLLTNERTNERTRLNYLDFYKGICIIFVIITHYDWTEQQRLDGFFLLWIDMAVPVFMTITGYVSAISFQRHKHSLKACYQPFEIIGKWLRFIVPFWGGIYFTDCSAYNCLK